MSTQARGATPPASSWRARWPLAGLAPVAQAYIVVLAALAGTGVTFAWRAGGFSMIDVAMLLVLTVAATAAQLFEVRTPNNKAYVATIAFLVTAALVLPPLGGPVVAATAFAIEGVRKHKKLYIEVFNTSSMSLCTLAAWSAYHLVDPGDLSARLDGSLRSVLGALAAVCAFLVVNHVSLVLVLLWARGVRPRDTDLLSRESVITDVGLLALGVVVAALWSVGPWLVAFAFVPFALLQRALHFPQLQQASRTDPKTGLANAAWFLESAAEELHRAQRLGQPLSFLIADLDLLRDVNNTYGHLAGDVVLQGVADVLRAEVREYDVAARFGGEEFAVLLPGADIAEATAVAERIRSQVARLRHQVDTSVDPIGATLSLGVATLGEHGHSVKELMHAGDLAVYRAKVDGRDRVRVASADDGATTAPERHAPATPVAKLLANGDPSAPGARAALIGTLVPAQQPPVEDRPAAPEEEHGTDPAVEKMVTVSEPCDEGGPVVVTVPLDPPPTEPATLAELGIGEPAKDGPDHRPSLAVRSTRPITVLTTVLALGLAPWAALQSPGLSWALLAFPLLALLTETVASDVYGSSSVSLSAVPVLAAVSSGHPGAALLAAAVSGIASTAAGRSRRVEQYLFNTSVLVLSTSVAVGVHSVMPIPPTGPWMIPASILATFFGAIVYFAVDNGLVAFIVGRDSGRRAQDVFRDDLSWLAPHFAAYGLLAALMGVAWNTAGLWGLLAFLLPPALVRLAQKQYLARTASNVGELRRLATDLASSKAQVERSNAALAGALGGLQEQHKSTAAALAGAIDARDSTTGGHIERVTALGLALCAVVDPELAADPQIAFGFLLHDVGKIGVPDAVLQKAGPLDDDERRIMNAHAEIGARIVADAGFAPVVREIVATHHERWDGTGYPQGLAGTDIPLCSRLFAIADALDAMTNDRPYRRGMPLADALAEVGRHAGTQFDPEAVHALLALDRTTLSRLLKLADRKDAAVAR